MTMHDERPLDVERAYAEGYLPEWPTITPPPRGRRAALEAAVAFGCAASVLAVIIVASRVVGP
jgi:hypothetical protein